MTVLLPQDGVALAREISDAIDARDLARAGALLDDGFLLHHHGVLLRQTGAVIA